MVKDTALIDLLKDHEESPFRGTDLEQWLQESLLYRQRSIILVPASALFYDEMSLKAKWAYVQ